MCKVTTGSLNANNLCEEIIHNICHIKKVPNNAWDTIITKINDARRTAAVTPEQKAAQKLKSLHDGLQVVFAKVEIISYKMLIFTFFIDLNDYFGICFRLHANH